MDRSEAYKIFNDLDNEDYTEEQKGTAIYMIANMATLNSVNKKKLVKAINCLIDMHFEVHEEVIR